MPPYQTSCAAATGYTQGNYRYHTGEALFVDALVAWGLTGWNDEAQIRGQFWDAALSTDAYTGDQTTSFDSHNWIVLTNNNTGGTYGLRGTILMATP